MKKNFKKFFVAAAVSFCAVFAFAKDESLDEILHSAAISISEQIDGKSESVAVIAVKSNYWALSDYIVTSLNDWLVQESDANIIARDDYTLSLIQQEADFQASGDVSDETMFNIGQALGADTLISGEILEKAGGYDLSLKATTTEQKKTIASWRGTFKAKDKDVKFLIQKSRTESRPKISQEINAGNSADAKKSGQKNQSSLTASIINSDGESVSKISVGDVIRIKVSSSKNSYLAIQCVDSSDDATWLPLKDNYIRAGETRLFPDIPGAILRVQEGSSGKEKVFVYSANDERLLPTQTKMMGTRALVMAQDTSDCDTAEINYRVGK